MSKVQLIYEGVSQIVGGPELGLLVLSDLTHTRQIAIVCDKHMEYELGLRTGEMLFATFYRFFKRAKEKSFKLLFVLS